MPPSYIRVRAVVWAYGRGQTDTHTQTHRRAWPQYILRRLRLTQNVTSEKSHAGLIYCWCIKWLLQEGSLYSSSPIPVFTADSDHLPQSKMVKIFIGYFSQRYFTEEIYNFLVVEWSEILDLIFLHFRTWSNKMAGKYLANRINRVTYNDSTFLSS